MTRRAKRHTSPPTARIPVVDRYWLGSFAFMLVGVVLALSSMRLKSVTYDETSHLTAGYSYLRTGDFRLTPDHPPLAEVMAGAALFTLDLKEPQWDGPAWDHGVVWKIGRDFLNRPNDVGAMLYRGRLMIVALWIVGGFLVCLWSRRQFGAAGGLISAAVYSLSPNLLAHARLVTTDIAAGVFFVGTLLGISLLLERVSPSRLCVSAVFLAGLFLSKFSALLILPVAPILLVMRVLFPGAWTLRLRRECKMNGRFGKLILSAAITGVLTLTTVVGIWAGYGFRFAASDEHPDGTTRHLAKPVGVYESGDSLSPDQRAQLTRQYGRDDVGVWEQLLDKAPLLRRGVLFLRDHRLLPEAYLYGLAFTVRSTEARQAFLWGRSSETGWWYYFPVAWAVKTPLAVFGVIVLALIGMVSRTPPRAGAPATRWSLRALSLFVILYTCVSMVGHINIGLRHLIPVQMSVFVLCGAAAAGWNGELRFRKLAVPVLLACLFCADLLAWPDYLPFFNSLVGGPRNGWKYLADSNMDWGQDLGRIADHLREQDEGKVKLAYFGTGRPEYYGIRASYFPLPFEMAAMDGGPPGPIAELTPGTYVFSTTALQGWNVPRELFTWNADLEKQTQELAVLVRREMTLPRERRRPELAGALAALETRRYARLLVELRKRRPEETIGHSIFIYRLTEKDLNPILGTGHVAGIAQD